jgi:hypothetical protein
MGLGCGRCHTPGRYPAMRERFFEAFALAYMIGWLLSRMPKRK